MAAQRLVHNVFFKLKENSPEAVKTLVACCDKYLSDRPGVLFYGAGTLCQELTREVNVRDWDVALHVIFVDKAAHDAYQVDPNHVQFLTESKPNFAQVRVFDTYV